MGWVWYGGTNKFITLDWLEGDSVGMGDNPLVLHSCNPVGLMTVLSHEDPTIGLASDQPTVVPGKGMVVGLSKLY